LRTRLPGLSDAALVPVERYVDGLMTLKELKKALNAYRQKDCFSPPEQRDGAVSPFDRPPREQSDESRVFQAWALAIEHMTEHVDYLIEIVGDLVNMPSTFLSIPSEHVKPDLRAESRRENRLLTEILRDVAGDRFSNPRFEPAWRTDTAVSLA